MKRIWITFLWILCLGTVLNCSSIALVNPQLNREWMLVSFKNYPKEELIRKQAKIDLTAPSEHGKIKGGAFMGCNKMFFTAAFKKDGTVKFSDIGSTLMACRDMKLEHDFARNFETMQYFKLEGHFLILNDNRGNTMKYIASDWD
ncbi:META domain-containing protein [Chryseobacterium endophyticum]|uniref:META domain-containing protein n=1 Tax=Chryseobacterium endophyticum TaxID=1854762 RepID=A0AAU6WPS3_9FLAO|nr:META domain-containing protein [uncultured Chryseobacterium sp.]